MSYARRKMNKKKGRISIPLRHVSAPHSGKILVVDDDKTVAITLNEILRQTGYHSDFACSGKEALEFLRRFKTDLIIVDLRLIDMNGLDLLTESRKLQPASMSIVLTGFGTMESAIRAMREGAFDYLIKPTDTDELLMRISHVFERRKLMDDLEKRVTELEAANEEIDRMNTNLQAEIDLATKKLQEHISELSATKDALEQQRSTRELFMNMVVHELRNPLQPIKVAADMIGKVAEDKDKVIKYNAIIQQEIARISQLINDLNDVTKIDLQRFSVHCVYADVAAVVKREYDSFACAHTERRFAFHCDQDAIMCMIDEKRISQAILNLLDNALKYSYDKTLITVTVALAAAGSFVDISVEDEGVGVQETKLNVIFDPYFRLREADPKIEGMGLGLYITRGIVEAHHGQIFATSVSDRKKGSIFTIHLPIANITAAD